MDAKKTAKKAMTKRPKKLADDTLDAVIWVRLEEGQTHRAISKELRISSSRIAALLKTDPYRVETIKSALKAERAEVYRKLNTSSLEGALAITERVRKLACRPGTLDQSEQGDLQARCTALRTLTGTYTSSLKAIELLTGSPTERIAQTVETNPVDMSADQIIELSIKGDWVDRLPETMRAEAQRRLAAQSSLGTNTA